VEGTQPHPPRDRRGTRTLRRQGCVSAVACAPNRAVQPADLPLRPTRAHASKAANWTPLSRQSGRHTLLPAGQHSDLPSAGGTAAAVRGRRRRGAAGRPAPVPAPARGAARRRAPAPLPRLPAAGAVRRVALKQLAEQQGQDHNGARHAAVHGKRARMAPQLQDWRWRPRVGRRAPKRAPVCWHYFTVRKQSHFLLLNGTPEIIKTIRYTTNPLNKGKRVICVVQVHLYVKKFQ
jgi:hypothetical protein